MLFICLIMKFCIFQTHTDRHTYCICLAVNQNFKNSSFASNFCSSLLFFCRLALRCGRGRGIRCGRGRRRACRQLALQSGDSMFEFAVRGFVLGQQTSVTRLQDVQRARHPLHLLLHLLGVGTLCCHLQDRRICCFRRSLPRV